MLKFFLAASVLGVGCASALAGTREDAFVVIEQFRKGYESGDPVALAKLFAPGAIFMGTTMPKPSSEPDAALKYFQSSAPLFRPKSIEIENYETLVLSDSAVLFAGQDTFTSTRDGKSVAAPARFTILAVKDVAGWRIGHFHSSVRPEAR